MSKINAVPILLLALFAVGCKPAPTVNESDAAANLTDGNAVSDVDGTANVMSGAAASGAGGTPLADYAGKYPFEEVGGLAFHNHPLVTAGIEKAVADKAVRDWVLKDDAGPSSPIALKDGKLLAWSCQQHNCGDHNWTVVIDPANGATEVCYHKVEMTSDGSLWYRPGAAAEKRSEPCPSE